jgi:hypothetical protein
MTLYRARTAVEVLDEEPRPALGDDVPEQIPIQMLAEILRVPIRWAWANADRFGGYKLHKGESCVSKAAVNDYIYESSLPCDVARVLKNEHAECATILAAVQATAAAMEWSKRHPEHWLSREITGYVYFGEQAGHLKIGFSNHPVRRLFEHRRDTGIVAIDLVIPGSIALEGELHRMFSKYRVRAELFRKPHLVNRFFAWLKEGLAL